MEYSRCVCGLFNTNTFFVSFPSGEHYVIDAPDGNEGFIAQIKRKTDSLTAILLTHGHFDHTNGLRNLLSAFPGTPIYLGQEDWYLLKERGKENKKLLKYFDLSDSYWKDDNPTDFLTYSDNCGPFCVLKTPGHTKGGVSLYVEEAKILFSGDIIFPGSEGRTDLGGDYYTLQETLVKLMKLPEATVVYPGHGGSTTIAKERYYRGY